MIDNTYFSTDDKRYFILTEVDRETYFFSKAKHVRYEEDFDFDEIHGSGENTLDDMVLSIEIRRRLTTRDQVRKNKIRGKENWNKFLKCIEKEGTSDLISFTDKYLR